MTAVRPPARAGDPPKTVQRLVFAAIVAVVLAGHAWWIHRYRIGFGISEDEARLLGDVERFRMAWLSEGPMGLVRAWQLPNDLAPGASLVTAPFLGPTHPEAMAYVELPFLAVLLASVAAIAHRLSGFRAAVLSMLVVATLPGVVWWSRVYELIVPGAALWAATIAMLLRSEHLARRWPTIGAGLLLAGGLVTRSMLIGFVPVLLIGILAQLVLLGVPALHLARRLARFVVPALLVASTRWVPAGGAMLDYLLGQGSRDPRSLADIADERDLLVEILGRPANLLILATVAVAAISLVRRSRDRAMLRRLLASDRGLLWWTAIGSFAVLCVVQEEFPGFELIVAVVLVPTALSIRWTGTRRVLAIGALAVVVVQATAFLSPRASWYQAFARQTGMSVPGDRPATSFRAWPAAVDATVDLLDERLPQDAEPVLVASPQPYFRAAHLRLATYWRSSPLSYREVDGLPSDPLDRAALIADASAAVTVDGSATVDAVDHLLRRGGFRIVRRIALPSGQVVEVWLPVR